VDNVQARVTAFLNEWERRLQTCEIIYSLGMKDGTLDLTVDDLRALSRAQPEAQDAFRNSLESAMFQEGLIFLQKAIHAGDPLEQLKHRIDTLVKEYETARTDAPATDSEGEGK